MNLFCPKFVSVRSSQIGAARHIADIQECAVASAAGWQSCGRKRLSLCRATVAIAVVVSATPIVRAEHARIDLRVSRHGKEVTATADQEPPTGGRNEPPVLTVRVDEPLIFQFFLTNTYPHKVMEHVQVRYYVARVGQIGRKPSSFRNWTGPDADSQPPWEQGVVTEGRFTMDFKPDCRVGTRLLFKISEPGFYSARVETLNTQSDHEHFSAIDVIVQ